MVGTVPARCAGGVAAMIRTISVLALLFKTCTTIDGFSIGSSTTTPPLVVTSQQRHSSFLGRRTSFRVARGNKNAPRNSRSTSTLSMILGNDGGILGVGAPEVAVTLIVGYFILGPSELYKLVKEIGKFIQNFRTLGVEASKSFESTMESQLELTELRKAQRELNDAFSFRRSINTDEYGPAFAEGEMTTAPETGGGAATAVASTAVTQDEGTSTTKKKKRKLIRRKKKKVPPPSEYPDLDLTDDTLAGGTGTDIPNTPIATATTPEEDRLRAERMERLNSSSPSASEPDWFTASEQDIAKQVLNNNDVSSTKDPALEYYEQQRFASQSSIDEWNSQIMANEDKLSPLSMVMKRLALLEQQKQENDRLLEEQYQKRLDNEDKYYLEQRRVLEDAIVEIQENVYLSVDDDDANGANSVTKKDEGGNTPSVKSDAAIKSETSKGISNAGEEKDAKTKANAIEKDVVLKETKFTP